MQQKMQESIFLKFNFSRFHFKFLKIFKKINHFSKGKYHRTQVEPFYGIPSGNIFELGALILSISCKSCDIEQEIFEIPIVYQKTSSHQRKKRPKNLYRLQILPDIESHFAIRQYLDCIFAILSGSL